MKNIAVFIIVFIFISQTIAYAAQPQIDRVKYISEKIDQIMNSEDLSDNTIEISYCYYTAGLPNPDSTRCDSLQLRNTEVVYSTMLCIPTHVPNKFSQECNYTISKEDLLILLGKFRYGGFLTDDCDKVNEKPEANHDYRVLSVSINSLKREKVFYENISRELKKENLETAYRNNNLSTFERELNESKNNGIPENLLPIYDFINSEIISKSPFNELSKAVRESDLPKIIDIVTKGPNLVNIVDIYGETPLGQAVKNGNKDMIESLLKKGANLKIGDILHDDTPLHYAAMNDHKQIAKILLSYGADANVENTNGDTPLHYAAIFGHKEIADLLISEGACVNSKDSINDTPLHEAALNGHTDVADLLISKGADVNAADNMKRTPLDNAMQGKGDIKLATILISKGANVNAKDSEGDTPMHTAVLHNHSELVKLLISKGADVNTKNDNGDTPLIIATKLHEGPIVCLLRMHGAYTLNIYDATATGDLAKVKSYLASNPLLTNSKFYNNDTALHIAAYWGHKEIAELLIGSGADINAKNDQDRTPLHLAVTEGKMQVAKLLILKGANVNLHDKWDKSPLFYALREGHKDIADLLRQHGAKE